MSLDVRFGLNQTPVGTNSVRFGNNRNRKIMDFFKKLGVLGNNPPKKDTFVPGANPAAPTQQPAQVEESQSVLSQTEVNARLTEASQMFTGKVMTQLTDKATAENMVFSPMNTFYLSQLLLLGAKSTTRDQLAELLSVKDMMSQGVSDDQVLAAVKQSRADLASLENEDVTFKTAYGVWTAAGKNIVWNSDYRNRLNEAGAKADEFKIGDAGPINTWASEQTNGKITEILSNDDVSGLARLVLGAAMYFKAPWNVKFQKLPFKTTFNGLNGPVDLNMMQNKAKVSYLHTMNYRGVPGNNLAFAPDFQAVTLPYKHKVGGRVLSMSVILPEANSNLKDVYKWLGSDKNLAGTLGTLTNSGFKKSLVQLTMPEFKAGSQLDTKEMFQAMGVTAPFDDQADFRGMIQRPADLYVKLMRQKAFIEVTKDGAEGGAVDVAVAHTRGSIRREEEPLTNMLVDRPFLYVVHEGDKPLMVGTVNDLTASEADAAETQAESATTSEPTRTYRRG